MRIGDLSFLHACGVLQGLQQFLPVYEDEVGDDPVIGAAGGIDGIERGFLETSRGRRLCEDDASGLHGVAHLSARCCGQAMRLRPRRVATCSTGWGAS